MCNFIHDEHVVPEVKTGIGYKIFSINSYQEVCSLIRYAPYRDKNGKAANPFRTWVEVHKNHLWNDQYIDGFCFFTTLNEAIMAWKTHFNRDTIIAQIEYEDCVCIQNESEMLSGHTIEIGLCKRFHCTLRYDDKYLNSKDLICQD
jgi:hypothetical protein